MADSKLGMHWIRVHPDGRDLQHVERMQYKSIKLFEWSWSDRDFCNGLLSVLPRDSYILARDHPLSEQEIWSDPIGTGTRQADEWADKVKSGRYHLPTDRTFFLGRNEPDATSGDRNAIDLYTAIFLERLQVHGLRGGAFNFSTGHPRTVDGTGATQADYTVFERSHRAIVRGSHIGVLHIYGTAAIPCAPGHYDRLKACPWQDVEWVVGECGPDEHVVGGGKHDGYLISMASNPSALCAWLDTLIIGVNDPRIHSYQVFTYDFSHPWDSFDTRVIRDALESHQWRHMIQHPTQPDTPPVDIHLPSIGTGAKPTLAFVRVPAGANLRATPESGAVLLAVPFGEPVQIVGVEDTAGWLRVRYNDTVGYMHSALLSLEPPQPTPQPEPEPVGDNWARCIAFVRKWEGGWADDPNDPGGATNKGVTIGTYKRWREAHGQPEPTKDDLRDLSDDEANQIFYEWYWLPSKSNELAWPLCLANFDTAVNAGVGRAQEMLHKSGNSFIAYMGHLISWYAGIDGFQHFGRAWMKRRADILLEASK